MSRLLVTGSRDWDNEPLLRSELKKAYRSMPPGERILVSGNAKGADLMAEKAWAEKADPNWIERHPAKDFDHPLKRNDYMVGLGADLCIAFLVPCYKPGCQVERGFHYSHGTQYTVDAATAAGIEVIEVADPTKPPF